MYPELMRNASLMSLLLLPALSLLPACQTQREEEPERQKTDEPAPLYLGTVNQVLSDRGFVILRFIGPVPASGATLITHPADGSNTRVGNLVLSDISQARGNFATASIRSGTVVAGDAVYLYRDVLRHPGKEQQSGTAGLPVGGSTIPGALPGLPGSEAGSAPGLSGTTFPGYAGGSSPTQPAAPSIPSLRDSLSDPVSDALSGTAGGAPAAPASAGDTAPDTPANTPSTPRRNSPAKDEFPAHLNDIPDNMNDWD